MPSILMIDDDERFAIVLKSLLTANGFEMRIASNGKDGLDMARQGKPDLILLDVMMPGLDGGGVKAILEKDPVLRRVPVLFLTSLVQPGEADRQANRSSGQMVVSKFASPTEILARIRRALTPEPPAATARR